MSDTNTQKPLLRKPAALLLTLLAHAVFGSSILPPVSSHRLSSIALNNQTNFLTSKINNHGYLHEDIFGLTLQKRSNRKKRFVDEALKQFKQAKIFHFGVAASNLLKTVGKSAVRSVTILGAGLVLFNLLHAKVNQILDHKNRVLDDMQQRSNDQNFQAGISDPAIAPPIERRSVKQPTK